ncbi:Glycosyl hydrolase 5 family protein [Cardamine amara subsp. amara]|uniref:Glycosyl hydrolase 5 family protein n=1 Tax=Cardamine amara subsp. amara TaxID=228776 RepID=A0ABD1AES8_CARAN
MERFFFISFFLHLFVIINVTFGFPLSTNSRWIVDDGNEGQRVKLTCINWPSHLETAVAEGLSKQPIDSISEKIVSMGFNCVRLTWPLYLATNESFSNIMTVRQSLLTFGLFEAVSGFQVHNPSILDLPLIKAFQEVVTCLEKHRVMVILDNHISQPGWCCNDNDGNGFFGDKHFNPDLWIKGLEKMASMFAISSNVVGMSLRNELRGPKQNIKDWYKYMSKGAEAVHAMNPNVLVIVSGLSYDTDLSFLRDKPFEVSFKRKLVFERHWYGFWGSWEGDTLSKICGRETENMMKMSGFLLEKGIPLFVSEFGVNQRGNNGNDNMFLSCFMALAADLDLDWALWVLAGSYYIRDTTIDSDESYGVLDWSWSSIRNITTLQKITTIQSPFQGPGLMETHQSKKIMFHPSSGICIVRDSLFQLKLGSCDESETWRLSSHQVLSVTKEEEESFCLKADEKDESVLLSKSDCSKWKLFSESKLQLSSITKNGGDSVCLDVDSESNKIVTRRCKCLEGNTSCDPTSQWFKLVTSTKSRLTKPKPFLEISPYSNTSLQKSLSV